VKNPEKTFQWIVGVLRKHNVPFVITGGLSAKSYGSARSLNDIDIDIHDGDINVILEDIRPYITFGPDHYRDDRWDLLLTTLNHEGQEIDLACGDSLKICDARNGAWSDQATDFSDVEIRDVFGIKVPVISRRGLIEYKSMLQGDHQAIDIKAALTAE